MEELLTRYPALKSCAGLDFAYYEGEIADCRDSVAKDLISAGYAKEIKPVRPKAGGKANADA